MSSGFTGREGPSGWLVMRMSSREGESMALALIGCISTWAGCMMSMSTGQVLDSPLSNNPQKSFTSSFLHHITNH